MLTFFICIIYQHISTHGYRGKFLRWYLKKLYKYHKIISYQKASHYILNYIDCSNEKISLIYSGITYPWICGRQRKPSVKYINIEHIVPQSLFFRKFPMVSDFHHLFPSSVVINKARSNFPYVEVNYNKCKLFCRHSKCSTIIPTHPDDYNCITHDKMFMPRLDNRGRIARAVLYFFTMYKDDMSMVGDLRTFLKWNRENPPTRKEFHRNNKINKTQGNRNPYIDDYRLADKAWDYD